MSDDQQIHHVNAYGYGLYLTNVQFNHMLKRGYIDMQGNVQLSQGPWTTLWLEMMERPNQKASIGKGKNVRIVWSDEKGAGAA